MKALWITGKNELKWDEADELIPTKGQVLVKIRAAGLNRADILQTMGLYPPPEGAPPWPGLELSGEIVSGPEHLTGKKIMALVPGGAFATHALVPENMLIPLPSGLSFVEGAAIPEALYTSYLNLFKEGKLLPGEHCLVHAAAGGIGTTALQIAGRFGAKITGTCGSPEKIDFCKKVYPRGNYLNYKDPEYVSKLKDSAPEGFDLIFDTVGGEKYSEIHTEILGVNGRWIVIGLLGGRKASLDFGKILKKNILLKGSTLRDKPADFKAEMTREITSGVLPEYINGNIKPVVDKTFDILEIEKAFNYLKSDKAKGKVVITGF